MMGDSYILGVSMSNHDRSACLLKNGRIVMAIAEERLDRRKASEGFYGANNRGIVLPPLAAINYVLHNNKLGIDDIDLVVCGRSVMSAREMMLTYLPIQENKLAEPPIPGHHIAHAYSAYCTSPFVEAAVLVIDERGHSLDDGQFEKCSWFRSEGGRLLPIQQFMGSQTNLSLGMFYETFAALTGLSEAGKPSAGKLMGLAPLGRLHPEWPQLIHLNHQTGDTSIPLASLDDFFLHTGLTIRPGMENFTVQKLDDLLIKYVPVWWQSELAADLAFKAQFELERAIQHISYSLCQVSSVRVLAYAGGVALNCTANSTLLKSGWTDVYIHPAAMDDGAAVGLALYGWIEFMGQHHVPAERFNPFLGKRYTSSEAYDAVKFFGLEEYTQKVSSGAEAARRVADGEIVCWFQGQSEWGPRALGGRSIVASPLIPGMQQRINSTIKYRERFRPLGVCGTLQAIKECIDISSVPPSMNSYMLAVGQVIDDRLAAVRHVDGTVRYQIAALDLQPELYRLLVEFGRLTGLSMVINTSFNLFGEPLVETPTDAVRQFLTSKADALVLENTLLAISNIPLHQLEKARRQAWSLSMIKPLHLVLSLEAAGYLEFAYQMIGELGYTAEDALSQGPDVPQRYHGFLMRAALSRGDERCAVRHAEEVLRYVAIPGEASAAARVLKNNCTDNIARRSVGDLVNILAAKGSIWNSSYAVFSENSLNLDKKCH